MHPGELFADQSWLSVMLGQGIEPSSYHPVVDNASDADIGKFISQVRSAVAGIVALQPDHGDYVDQYCKMA